MTLGGVAPKTLELTKEDLAPEQTVLDLGCGPGALTNSLVASVAHIHAIDTSAGMIDVASAQAAEQNLDNVECG